MRVWDAFFFQKDNTLPSRVAVAILSLAQKQILLMNDAGMLCVVGRVETRRRTQTCNLLGPVLLTPGDIMAFLARLPQHVTDATVLLRETAALSTKASKVSKARAAARKAV